MEYHNGDLYEGKFTSNHSGKVKYKEIGNPGKGMAKESTPGKPGRIIWGSGLRTRCTGRAGLSKRRKLTKSYLRRGI